MEIDKNIKIPRIIDMLAGNDLLGSIMLVYQQNQLTSIEKMIYFLISEIHVAQMNEHIDGVLKPIIEMAELKDTFYQYSH
jgi:hypothetical protein